MSGDIQSVVPAVQAHLLDVLKQVNSITDPATGKALQIPHFSDIYQAAERLDSVEHPARFMSVINTLLGRANCVGFDAPSADYQVTFPLDHHMHLTMGNEWYWIGCHLNVVDSHGNTGRISMLQSLQKIRAVGLAAQQNAGWTNEQATVASNVVTVTVDMGPAKRAIYRRSTNNQWPLKGGTTQFSQPGDSSFQFVCGPDSLTGSADVLPLVTSVNDGSNMTFNLTLTPGEGIAVESAHFMQGVPQTGSITAGGTGVTLIPTPGIYYSWPQLQVGGTLTVNGTAYTVLSGTGWLDHQLMMSSLENPDGKVHPVPFVDDAQPCNGWVWQFYNLDNGQAFTGAGFILGEMIDNPKMSYGYFLKPNDKQGWDAIFINGQINLMFPNQFPAQVGDSASAKVDLPIIRSYSGVENMLLGKPLSGVASPWFTDGTFNNPDGGLCSEIPADYVDLSGNYANGLGYMESVGFQPVADYVQYALAVLKG